MKLEAFSVDAHKKELTGEEIRETQKGIQTEKTEKKLKKIYRVYQIR